MDKSRVIAVSLLSHTSRQINPRADGHVLNRRQECGCCMLRRARRLRPAYRNRPQSSTRNPIRNTFRHITTVIRIPIIRTAITDRPTSGVLRLVSGSHSVWGTGFTMDMVSMMGMGSMEEIASTVEFPTGEVDLGM